MDGKGQDGCAVSIPWQKGRKVEDDAFSATKCFGKLIQHEQNVGQCRMLCLLKARSCQR